MRSLSIRMLIALSILLVPTFVYADVTITGTNSFASLDGGPDDADHTVNGVFTVNGNLIVNGTINCNDTGGSSSACPMAFNVSGDMTINAGGALYAEDRTGTGTGGAITISVGGNFVMHGATATLPAAIISSSAKNSSGSNGGAITTSVTGTISIENGATIDAGSSNAAGGKVTLLGGGHIDVSGNVFSGPSRTVLSTLHTGQALDGGTSNQSGGEIYIQGTSYTEPGVTIGSTANIVSQGQTNGAGPVTVEGCGVVVKGLVAALAMKDYNARVDIRSGKSVTVDARDLGVANATLGRNGQIRVDAPTGAADHHTLDIYAGTAITINGPDPAASSLFALSGLPGANTSKSDGATMHIMAVGGVLTGTVTGSGNLISDGRVTSGDGGGHIEISAQGDVSLDTARILAIGDSNTNNTNRNGGSIAIRSYSGNVIWTNGVGDVTPTGSNVPTLQRGSISLTACGTITTSGSTFPTNGSPVGTFPATTTGACSPATPSLPNTEAALPVCNNPPVADNISATTNEDNAVTITMTASDIDGDSITFTIVTPPSHGTLSAIFNPTPTSAQVTYTPAANYNGTDSFTFQADDGKGGTSIGTVTITINPVNDPPTFNLGANPVTSNEDAGPQTIANYASSISPGPTADEQTQTVTFTVTNDNNALFSVQPAIASNGTLTYTSAPNANGSANVVVVAHDNGGTANGGNDTSGPQNFNIIVNAVNDAPSFTKGADQTVLEDSGAHTVSGWATAISAGPPDESSQTVTFNVANNNNALFSAQPAVASDGTLTFTSAPNANGVATVTVTAHDNGGTANGGVDTSAPQTFTITVVAVNDPPSFTKGSDVTVLEDSGVYSQAAWATNISAGPADEAGQTVHFNITNNTNTALFSVQPAVANDGTLTFTTAANANGSATITLNAQDDGGTANGGVDTSASQTFVINVTAVNDAPSFTKGADQTSFEDAGPQTVAGWATAISAGPPDESSQTVTFNVSNDNNALFSVQPAVASDGTLTYTSAPNANGVATVTVAAHDDGGTANGGVDTSAPQTFTITVTMVNDPPSFTKGADQTVLEDSGPHTVTGWATAISPGPPDESSQTVTFTVTNDNNALFSAQPAVASDGTLTFTSAPDANGTATVTVTAHDDGGTANGGNDTSASQTFVINVTAVNDAPSFTKGADQTSLEDAGPQTVAGWATGISAGPANESSQTVTFIVNNNNNGLFSAQPAVASNGTLTYTSAPNANGVATVTVAAHDNGGTANGGVDTSASQTFTITVTAVNDAPSFTKGADQTVLEDSGPHTVTGWATSISAGPADESSQTVSFTTSNDNNALFSSQPSVDASGNLTFTSAPDANGTATVTVTAHDNGGTANGGVDTSAPQTFVITVTSVNDAPSFTKGPDESVISDAGPQSYVAWATNISAGPANESAQTVSFIVNNDNNAVFTAQPAVSSSGTLTFTTAVAAPTTTVHVTVAAHDDGGTANGGVDTSATQTFNINVTHANQPPVANPDSYDAVGNTELVVGTPGTQAATLSVATGSVLANDTDSDSDPLTATIGTFTAGASVTMNSDGTFRYLPPAGFSGDDTFTYVVNDGHGHNVTGTVTIHVTKRVLYVKNNGGGSTGRVDSPYATLAAAQAASADNDTIYLFTGDGTTSGQSNGILLNHNGERLIGEGVALTASGTYNGASNPQLRAAGTAPKMSNTTGAGVTITGVGTLSNNEVSGVEITTATNAGVTMGNVANVTMDSDKIDASTNSGVRGTAVNGFSFTNGSIASSGSVSGDANMSFDNLTGSASVANSTFSGAFSDNIRVANTSGSLNRLTLTNDNFNGNSTTTGNNAVNLTANTGTTLSATVTGSHFTSTRGQHFQLSMNGIVTSDLVFTGNTISNSQTALSGGGGVLIATGGGNTAVPTLTYNISNNSIRDAVGSAISVSKGTGTGSATGSITGNTIGITGVTNSGSSQGDGITITHVGGGSTSTTITNNAVAQYNNNGISLQIGSASSGGNGSMLAIVQSNTVSNPGSFALNGFLLNSGTSSGDAHTVCLTLGGSGAAANAITGAGSVPNGGFDARLRQRMATTVRLAGYAGANNDNAAVAAYVQSQNGGTPTVSVSNSVPTGGGYVGGTCP